MEPRFGYDFSQVRIHDDAHAARAARSVDAHAFTVGGQIVLNATAAGRGTRDGLRLLAHELAHVVQQHPAGVGRTRQGVGAPVGVYRQATGTGSSGPTRRVVYLDTDVLGAIADGNRPAARALQALRAANADIRIARYNYVEATHGEPARAGARQLIVQELGITIDEGAGLASRLPTYGRAALEKIDVQSKDLPMIAAVRLAGADAELWSFDGGVKTNAPRLGVKIAPESKLNDGRLTPSSARPDVRTSLNQVGLDSWDITTDGTPIRRPVVGAAAAGRPGHHLRAGAAAATEPPARTASGEITQPSGGPVPRGRSGPPGGTPAPAPIVEAEAALEEMRRANARSAELNARIQTYLKTYFAIYTALTYLKALTTGLTVMVEGTALPDEQRQADSVLKQSEEAKLWANYFSRPSRNDIIRLYTRGDRAALAEIAATCGSFSTTQHSRARTFGKLGTDLAAAARTYYTRAFENLVDAQAHTRIETASAATELLMGDAQMRIFNGLRNASENYAQAAITARATADDAEWIANVCNNMLIVGFHSLTPRCDFLGEDCEKERREVELARQAGQILGDPWR